MAAPSMGGVSLPRGNGQTVRLPRGASLTDLAERINAEPAALVTALFHLGEMITATQSVNDETLQLLGAEIGWVIQVVSPRTRTASSSRPSTSPSVTRRARRRTGRPVRRW